MNYLYELNEEKDKGKFEQKEKKTKKATEKKTLTGCLHWNMYLKNHKEL